MEQVEQAGVVDAETVLRVTFRVRQCRRRKERVGDHDACRRCPIEERPHQLAHWPNANRSAPQDGVFALHDVPVAHPVDVLEQQEIHAAVV